jgi:high frequency lysogenization protein
MNEARTLALAGVFQAAALVQALATGRSVDADAARASLHSVFMIDADDVAHVYDGRDGLRLGLHALIDQLDGPRRDLELTRLVLAMLRVERKLGARNDLVLALRKGIESTRRQRDHFDETHAAVQARLGELYEQTLSTLRPRVMVSGDPHLLQQPAQVARIRAMLLAGVRSAVLWHQLGGRQWQLLLQRRQCAMLARGLQSRITLERGE